MKYRFAKSLVNFSFCLKFCRLVLLVPFLVILFIFTKINFHYHFPGEYILLFTSFLKVLFQLGDIVLLNVLLLLSSSFLIGSY